MRHLLGSLVMLGAAACGNAAPTTSNISRPLLPSRGALVNADSLTAVDDGPLPCCTVDSSGVSLTIVAGTLDFYRSGSYTDSVITPEGPVPKACVQQVANGATIERNHLVVLLDGESYLGLPCSSGVFSIDLTERATYPDGSSADRVVTLATGPYTWTRDTLVLTPVDGSIGTLLPSMSGASITVNGATGRYRFVSVPLP
jgi:hypothetical protein